MKTLIQLILFISALQAHALGIGDKALCPAENWEGDPILVPCQIEALSPQQNIAIVRRTDPFNNRSAWSAKLDGLFAPTTRQVRVLVPSTDVLGKKILVPYNVMGFSQDETTLAITKSDPFGNKDILTYPKDSVFVTSNEPLTCSQLASR